MLKRQLKYCTWKTKLTLYKTIMGPTLNNASCVWSPHLKYLISDLEKVQRRAVRWIKGFKGDESITTARIEINVETLLDRRICRDNKVFKQIENGAMDLDTSKYINTNTYDTRHKYLQQTAGPGPFYHSFYQGLYAKSKNVFVLFSFCCWEFPILFCLFYWNYTTLVKPFQAIRVY